MDRGRRGSAGRAASTSCAATWCPRPSGCSCSRWRARCWWATAGELAEPARPPALPRAALSAGAPAARPRARRVARAGRRRPTSRSRTAGAGSRPRGREYVVVLDGDANTPRPWCNVLANPELGTVVTPSGASFTWAENSRENRLTPFANDAVSDPSSERLFVRGRQRPARSGRRRCPASAARADGRCVVARHRPGRHALRARVARPGARADRAASTANDPVKIQVLSRDEPRHAPARGCALFAYVEWVAGPAASARAPARGHRARRWIGAVLARNAYNQEFAGARRLRGVQPAARARPRGDRTEFLGRNGDPRRPAALARDGARAAASARALDPCAAPRGRAGAGARRAARGWCSCSARDGTARRRWRSLARYASADAAARRLRAGRGGLGRAPGYGAGAARRTTPSTLMMNGWLLYQTLACAPAARAAGTTSPAAPSASATSCRT